MGSWNGNGRNRPGGSAFDRAHATSGRVAKAFEQGAKGEQHVAKLLRQLDSKSWSVRHDLQLEEAGWNADHLVIGPPGIFVIDTKNVSGLVQVVGEGITLDGHPKDYVQKVVAQVLAVREILQGTGSNPGWVQGVLAFVEADLEVRAFPRDVMVIQAANIAKVLSQQPQRLSNRDVQELVEAVEQAWG